MTTSKPIGLTPYLICQGAARALDFYRQAFGAREDYRLMMDDGRVGHAELQIGPARLAVADEFPEEQCRSPKAYGGSPVTLHLYVEDVDAFCARATAAGAQLSGQLSDEFYGDRVGRLVDPFGHVWMIATRKEEVSPEEMQRRMRGK